MNRRRLIGSLIGVLILVTALVLIAGRNEERAVNGSKKGATSQTTPSAPKPSSPEAPTVEVAPVVAQALNLTSRLPGELQPYLSVALYPKITGIVEWIGVDRGSQVKQGQLLVRLLAPEVKAQRAEAQAKLQGAESTYARLKSASATPGVVAGQDLEVAQKTVEADRARVQALREMESYLLMKAPFDGVVTERNVHPGALIGPASAGAPVLRLEQASRLRLVVWVPEAYVGGIAGGETFKFTVPAYPGESFSGSIARIARSVDVKTRTMPVEMDVKNQTGRLSPGMFAEVEWSVRRPTATLFVPTKSVVTTSERTFVLSVRDGSVEWITVSRGASQGDLVEVFGALSPGDQVVRRGTDELRPGTRVVPRVVPAPPK
jgi:membrane fusion protein (multidrug efflux system)